MGNQCRQTPPSTEAIQRQILREQHPGENGASDVDDEVGGPERRMFASHTGTEALLRGQSHGNPGQIGSQYPISQLLWFHELSLPFLSLSLLLFLFLFILLNPISLLLSIRGRHLALQKHGGWLGNIL